MSGVETTHPEYDKMLPEWKLVKACASGSREVKALKTDILPAPGTSKDGSYDLYRYKSYLARAIYTNITGRTKQGLVGAAFRLPATVELPTGLKYLSENADGAGESLEQLAKDTFASLLEDGRQVLLSDYPQVEEGLTAEQVSLINPQATIKRYEGCELTNWKTEVINGRLTLTMATLLESYNDTDNEFTHDPKKQYRVLRLTSEGYSQQIYRDGDPATEEFYPKQSDGSAFDFIPLFIVGSQNNDPSTDDIPLSDIAHVNVGHYRNSADLEESAYVAGQAMIHIDIGEMDDKSWAALNPNGIAIGATTSIQTAGGGTAAFIQAEAQNIYTELQDKKEAQMLALGAKMVEQRNPNETAAAAKIDATGENSVLSDLVANVEEGILRCVEWCGMFMGEQGKATYKMNRQFFDDSIDPQMLMAAIQGYQLSVIPKSSVQNSFRKSGIVDADITNDELDAQLGTASPLE